MASLQFCRNLVKFSGNSIFDHFGNLLIENYADKSDIKSVIEIKGFDNPPCLSEFTLIVIRKKLKALGKVKFLKVDWCRKFFTVFKKLPFQFRPSLRRLNYPFWT